MSLASGKLNRWVAIEKRTGAVDALNQPTDTWELVEERWANFKGQTGMGASRAQEGVTKDISAVSWRIRYCPVGIDAGMRVNHGGIFYDIRGVRHDEERQEWTDLVCERGGNNG